MFWSTHSSAEISFSSRRSRTSGTSRPFCTDSRQNFRGSRRFWVSRLASTTFICTTCTLVRSLFTRTDQEHHCTTTTQQQLIMKVQSVFLYGALVSSTSAFLLQKDTTSDGARRLSADDEIAAGKLRMLGKGKGKGKSSKSKSSKSKSSKSGKVGAR